VVGLDYRDAGLDVHQLFQRMKTHPLFRGYLTGGEMVEWGAKTIPEGGYYSVPARRSGAGVVILGDAGGFVDVPSLKGIHYAMQPDAEVARRVRVAAPFVPDGKLTFSKVDAVFKSGNATRDTIPTHLLVGQDVSRDVADLYARMCPAGVYEVADGSLRVNAPN